MNIISSIILVIILAYALGYFTAWVAHSKVFKRIRNTRHYMKKGHSLRRAWNYAGQTL